MKSMCSAAEFAAASAPLDRTGQNRIASEPGWPVVGVWLFE
jgi:hypothetical protein